MAQKPLPCDAAKMPLQNIVAKYCRKVLWPIVVQSVVMNRLIIKISNAVRIACKTYLTRLFPTILAGCLLLTTGVNAASNPQEARQQKLGEAIRQRVEETDKTNRPKTTGQFLDEARGDVPLDQRLENITRDSVEAFKKLGEEYTPDLGQAARDLREGAAEAGRNLAD